MPPRYVYWTILIDGKATAFRARERDELLPTFNQLKRKNADIVMRYFAHGKLWDSPEQAAWANRNAKPPREPRGADWRPGGTHTDPRARFDERRERKKRPFRPRERPDGSSATGGPKDQPPPDRRPAESRPRTGPGRWRTEPPRPEGSGPNASKDRPRFKDRRPEHDRFPKRSDSSPKRSDSGDHSQTRRSSETPGRPDQPRWPRPPRPHARRKHGNKPR
jgi:hypothetical protein